VLAFERNSGYTAPGNPIRVEPAFALVNANTLGPAGIAPATETVTSSRGGGHFGLPHGIQIYSGLLKSLIRGPRRKVMSTSATGSVVENQKGAGLEGLRVVLEDVTLLHDGPIAILATDDTKSKGEFSLKYRGDTFVPDEPGKQIRRLQLTIRLGQLVIYKGVPQNDLPFQDALSFDPIRLPRAEAESWWATLGSGKPSRVTEGNAIRWLADNDEAWRHVAAVIKNPSIDPRTASDPNPCLDVMQLNIDIDTFDSDFRKEKPIVVLDFKPVVPKGPQDAHDWITDDHQLHIDHADDRIERLFLDASTGSMLGRSHPVDVRIQIPRMTFGLKATKLAMVGIGVLLILGFVLSAFVLAWVLFAELGVGWAGKLLSAIGGNLYRSSLSKEPKLEQWFKDAGDARIDVSRVRVRELKMRSLNITHAKIVINRGREAVLLGSPFKQVYFDSHRHYIDEPRRGQEASKGPIHDVSVAVRGPAVWDLQELFNSHWNLADPGDPQKSPPVPPQETKAKDGEFIATVQVVRTLDRMFSEKDEKDGEKGILEAYLRAIHFAERFIYIENQYFHNYTIAQALIDALAAKPHLEVILLLNVSPDMAYYLRWQLKEIARITKSLVEDKSRDKSLSDEAAVKKRFGVFTSWSHEKGRLVDNYLHTKTAIIDNRWATVGSANLDGASLDSEDYFRSLLDGDVRHTEANVVIFEDAAVQTSAVDALRRRLWAEHLGFVDEAGELTPESDDLKDMEGKNSKGETWLEVWSQKADKNVADLKSPWIDVVNSIHVLPAPFPLKYGPDFDETIKPPGLSAWQTLLFLFFKLLRPFWVDHYASKNYLDHLFSPDKPPSDIQPSAGPPSYPFTYR
jgi:phosphatidylserine/phosphatidylglycerophosphate/cardiolipin synthase-like enzyme